MTRSASSVRLKPEQIAQKMACRLWDSNILAKASGLDRVTAYKAAKGEPIQRRSALKIARAFAETPEIPGMRESLSELDMELVDSEELEEVV